MPKYSATFDMQTGICLRAARCCRVLIIKTAGGNVIMKNIWKKLTGAKVWRTVNMLALATLIYTANTTCLWAHHQPKVPEGLEKFRKF